MKSGHFHWSNVKRHKYVVCSTFWHLRLSGQFSGTTFGLDRPRGGRDDGSRGKFNSATLSLLHTVQSITAFVHLLLNQHLLWNLKPNHSVHIFKKILIYIPPDFFQYFYIMGQPPSLIRAMSSHSLSINN